MGCFLPILIIAPLIRVALFYLKQWSRDGASLSTPHRGVARKRDEPPTLNEGSNIVGSLGPNGKSPHGGPHFAPKQGFQAIE